MVIFTPWDKQNPSKITNQHSAKSKPRVSSSSTSFWFQAHSSQAFRSQKPQFHRKEHAALASLQTLQLHLFLMVAMVIISPQRHSGTSSSSSDIGKKIRVPDRRPVFFKRAPQQLDFEYAGNEATTAANTKLGWCGSRPHRSIGTLCFSSINLLAQMFIQAAHECSSRYALAQLYIYI